MDNDKNFLSDIEGDIDGDWEDIQKRIKEECDQEVLDENLKEPLRMNFPSYKEFYECLKRIFLTYDNESDDEMVSSAFHDFHVLLRRMFSNHNRKMPKAFDKVWEIFCDPIKYKTSGIYCKQCKEKWDIIYELDDDSMRMNEFRFRDEQFIGWNETMMNRTITRMRVHCPNCEYPISEIMGGELIGIFKHEHIREDEDKINHHGGRGNGIKRKFEHNI